MPSPFPGMDPFIEDRRWGEFHLGLICVIQEMLTPSLIPRYYARVQEYVYVEHDTEEDSGFIIPDDIVLESGDHFSDARGGVATATAVALEPIMLALPIPEERRHVYLTIRDTESRKVVTAIEVLSPKNKRASSDGRGAYLKKREKVLMSTSHLVEIDLLRGGARLPVKGTLPPGDYYAIVSRWKRRPMAEVYAWTLRQPLPPIPIPLDDEDPDLLLDLQNCCATVYDRAAYGYSMGYHRPLRPALADEDAAWVQEVLAAER